MVYSKPFSNAKKNQISNQQPHLSNSCVYNGAAVKERNLTLDGLVSTKIYLSEISHYMVIIQKTMPALNSRRRYKRRDDREFSSGRHFHSWPCSNTNKI